MGGHPKGLLPAPQPNPPQDAARPLTLVERLATLAQAQGLPVVLVGQHADYAGLGLPLLADQPPGRGPLGGLMALLLEAQSRQLESVIALSCDLPYLDHSLLARLCQTATAGFDAVAPRWTPPDRAQPIWEPLCARYFLSFVPALRAALSADGPSLQRLLQAARTLPLGLAPGEVVQVKDWDSPADLPDGSKPLLRPRSA